MIDITRALTPGHPNWPGDTPLTLQLTASMANGQSVNVMRLCTSTHCGTHLDAPYHYRADGGRLSSIPLGVLIGEALVIDAHGSLVLMPSLLERYPSLPERVLFYTGQPAHWETFPEGFTSFAPDLIEALAARGVKLIGTDAPSIDPLDSKDLPAHRACAETGLVIVEGLMLSGVAPGSYRLVCLPLNLPEADASPVRAVLL